MYLAQAKTQGIKIRVSQQGTKGCAARTTQSHAAAPLRARADAP